MRKLIVMFALFLGAILGNATLPIAAQAAVMPSASPVAYGAVPLGSMLLASDAVAARYTGPRHKFAKPSANPHELAERVRASLRLDPTGRSAIDGPNCGLACGTPEDFLDMVQASDLRDVAPKDVGQLADFLDHLELLQHAPAGTYWMACKSGNGSASSEPVWNCMSRRFHAGEPCYAYKGRCVLARDCSNPVGRELQVSYCVRQLVWMNQGDVLRGAPMAPAGVSEMPVNPRCPMLVREPGSDENAYPPMNKCPRAGCDFSMPAADLRMRVLSPQFSFRAKTAGWAVIYLPIEVTQWAGVMEYCIEPVGGQRMAGKDIHRTAYHNHDAYLVYSPRQVPDEWQGLPHVWHLYTGGSYAR